MDVGTFIVICVVGVLIGITLAYFINMQEGFANRIDAYKNSGAYKTQLKLVTDLADVRAGKRTDYQDAIERSDMTPDATCLVNFYALGARFAGYLGPFKQGYFDTDNAIRSALKMGCRVLVLEIGTFDKSCDNYPRLVTRGAGKPGLNQSVLDVANDCNDEKNSNILDACTSIAQYAFGPSVPNPSDPVIVVLYVQPSDVCEATNGNKEACVTFCKRIAAGLAPLLPFSVKNVPGAAVYRQKNEQGLLMSPIENYQQKVLFFSNVNTDGFRGRTDVPTNLDLDYIVNLRLTYVQTELGATLMTNSNSDGGKWGILDAVDGWINTPDKDLPALQTNTNSRWTILLSNDPSTIVSKKDVTFLQQKVGVQCIPIQIWSKEYDYMFQKGYFDEHSFVPKPAPLRAPRQTTFIPAPANPELNANGGILKSPKTV
jgi:hypothetical protein